MALRELLIKLSTRVEGRSLDGFKQSLDATKARVAALDTGLDGLGGHARAAVSVSGAAFGELARTAATAGAQTAAALGQSLAPIGAQLQARLAPARASLTATAVRAQEFGAQAAAAFARAGVAAESRLGAPVRAVALQSFGALSARAQASSTAIAASLGRVQASVRTHVAAPLQQAAVTAQQTGVRIAQSFAPVFTAVIRVRREVGNVLEPTARATAQSRITFSQWGTAVSRIATSAAADLRDRVTAAAASATGAVSRFTQRLRASRQGSGGPVPKPGGGGGSGLLQGAVGGIAGGLAVGAIMQGTTALARYAAATLETAGKVRDLADATGASTDAIQLWRGIASEVGASETAVQAAFKGLSIAVTNANAGNKDAVKMFKDLGVEIQDATGKTRPLEELLREVGGALGELEDPAKRSALAQKAMTEAGLQLLPAFAAGKAGLDEMIAKHRELSVVMDEGTINQMDKVGERLEDVQRQFAKIGPAVLVAFAPLIDTFSKTLLPLLPVLVQAITPIVDAIAQGLGPVVASVMPLFAKLFGEAVPVIQKLAPVIGKVVNVLAGAWGPLIEGMAPILEVLAGVIGEVVAALADGLQPVIMGLVPVAVSLYKAFLPLVPALLNALLPAVLALLPSLLKLAEAFVPLIEQLVPVLVELLTMLTPVITLLANVLAAVLGPAINIVSGYMQAWIAWIRVIGRTLGVAIAAVQALWAAISGNGEAMDAASAALDAAIGKWWSAVETLGRKILSYFAGVWNSVAEAAQNVMNTLGIGDGKTMDGLKVDASGLESPVAKLSKISDNLKAGAAGGVKTSQTINNATTNNSTTHQSTTINDERTLKFEVTGAASPAQTGQAVASSVGNLLDTDRRRTLDLVASHG